ncbi:DUF4239 domain-containing protein [Microbispora bryophytorum]|uniref:DUF4239 domain-containing protein n=1 Tax=Microbispora bryophytorum subsp. camponoti TaxID=1677852 RepID=A0ABR8KWV4_9ACTN|nr:DUF4239 domain-containing protein [Microbispora camponoti]MBD3141887.1 DUF4239 domain-containing protein [Microbispora camponoti]
MLIGVLAVAAAVGLVAVAALLFRVLGRGTDDRDPGGASAGHAGSMLSSLFLLVFAIAIVVPWTSADSARQNTYAETQALVEAYWAAAPLPAPDAAQVREGLREYARYVLEDEWPQMAAGHLGTEGTARLESLRARVTELPITTDEARGARDTVLERMGDLSAARRQRAADVGTALPPGVMLLTVLTGVLVVVFPFLAGARPRGLTLVPVTAMAVLLGVGVYLAWNISHPFSGGLAVKPDAFVSALHEFQRIPEGH